MSILMRGVEMPKNCEECNFKGECRQYWEKIREVYTRPSWCPLIEVADTPQTDCLIADARFKAHCLNCVENGSYKCTKCDGEMYYKADAPHTNCEDIYPLVIIEDRYTGVYSNGEYTAWNMYFDEIPQDIDGDDVSCYDFWHSYNGIVGLGRTPNEAIEDLRKKLNAERNEDDK